MILAYFRRKRVVLQDELQIVTYRVCHPLTYLLKLKYAQKTYIISSKPRSTIRCLLGYYPSKERTLFFTQLIFGKQKYIYIYILEQIQELHSVVWLEHLFCSWWDDTILWILCTTVLSYDDPSTSSGAMMSHGWCMCIDQVVIPRSQCDQPISH